MHQKEFSSSLRCLMCERERCLMIEEVSLEEEVTLG